MADGNLGSLWFQLGLKDNTSKELQKIIDKLKTGDDAANALLRALQGFGTKKSGFKEQAEKAKEFSDVLLELNRRISKLRKNDKGDEAKDLQTAVKNALSYLDMLQKINIERSKISELRSLNPNVDTSKLREAEVMLENVNSQLLRLQGKPQGGGGGGVDQANVLQDYSKVLQMTLRDVKQITDQFKKENPLSAFSGGAAKVEADIARVTEKLAKMRDLMSEGVTKGYNTSMLVGSLTELDKVLSRLQAASGNKSILTDAAQMKNLLSDVAVEMTKATSATQAYGREKGKVIAQEREYNKTIAEYNSIQSGENRQKKALTDIELLLKNINALSGKSIGLGQDVSKLEAMRSEIERIKADISSFSGKGLISQEFKNALADLSNLKTRAHDVMKDQSSANKEAESQSKLIERTKQAINSLASERAELEKNREVAKKFSSEIASLNSLTEKAFYSKAFGGESALQGRIAAEEKALEKQKNILEEHKRHYDDLVKKASEYKNELRAISPSLDGKNNGGADLIGAELEKYRRLTLMMETYNEKAKLYEGKFGEIGLQEYAIERQKEKLEQLKELQKEISKMDGAGTSGLKDKLLQKNKELLQSEKEYSAQLKANEKQRQKEIESSLNRIQSLKYALQNLWGKRQEARTLNIDTTKVDAKIQETIGKIRFLEQNLAGLRGDKFEGSLGKIGSIGAGSEVRSINHLAQEQAAANREAQKGVEIEQKRQQEIAKSAAKARNDLAAAFAGANAETKKMQSIVSDIKSLFLQGGIVFGAQQFFNSIVQTGGEIVQQHVALRSILGDVQKADELFAQTQQLALQSPFKFGELNRDVKQLAAFGVEANDLYDTTKRLADIASGLGVSFERLGLAYGQVKARSWLDGKELRQFAYAGLPLLQKITDLYNQEGKNGKSNYTQADVKKMISARQVSFEDVQKVLWNMTNEGGQFYNMQLVLSETLLGRWNKLIDAWDIMLGKFAEGKNVVGGTFSFIINRVTDLVLALDKLSPALLSFGAAFAVKKFSGFAASKLGFGAGSFNSAYTAKVNAQLKSYAIEQQQLVVEKQITQEEATQNVQKRAYMLADAESQKATMNRLALEGKLSILQMQKAAREGLVSKELVNQLVIMGQITQKQAQIILQGNAWQAALSTGMSKFNNILNMFGGWWGIAIATLTSMLMGFSQYRSKMEQEAKNLQDSARQNLKQFDDFLNNMKSKPSDRDGLQKEVDGMKDLLEQSNLYTDTIKEQVESAGDLSKQYDVLKQKVKEARDATQFSEKFSNAAVGAVARSGQSQMVGEGLNTSHLETGWKSWIPDFIGWVSGIFDDDLETNANELVDSMNKVSLSISTAFDDSQRQRIENVANSLLPANDHVKSLEEKIAILRDKGGDSWDNFVNQVARGDENIKKHLEAVGDGSEQMMSDINEIATDDMPKMIGYLQQYLHLYGNDFNEWCKRNPHRYAEMWDEMLAVAKVKAPAIADIIKRLAMAAVGIVTTDDRKGGGGKPSYNPGIDTDFAGRIRKKAFKTGVITGTKKKGKFWVREFDSALRQIQADSYEETGQNIQKKLKESRNELDVMNTFAKGLSGKAKTNFLKSGRYLQAKRDNDLWSTMANLGNISDDLGKNKVTGNFGKDKNKNGGRKEDTELKDLQDRVKLYEKMYSEYRKYKDLYGKGALEQLTKDGEFAPIFSKKNRKLYPISDYTNYETSIKELLGVIPTTTRDRRAYKESKTADIAGRNRELEQQQRSDQLNELNEQLNIISEQYDIYKKMYELTGNKRGAENIAFGGIMEFDSFKKYLEEQLDVSVKNDNALYGLDHSTQDVKEMSLSNVKDQYGKESITYDIKKQLEDENKKIKSETISLMADLIEKNATIEQQIDDENRKYERQLELIKGIEDPQMRQRAHEGAEKTHNETTAKLQFEQFKQGSDWVTIFDDLNRVSSTTINSMVDKIDDFSKKTGLSVEVVKQLREALSKLRDEQIERNPIEGIIGGMQRGNAIGSYLSGHGGPQYMNKDRYVLTGEQANKMGLQSGGKGYSKADLENEQKGAYNDMNKGINGLVAKFNALKDCLDPVIGLFDSLGMEDTAIGQGASVVGGALGAGAQVANGLSAFGGTLSSLGPYGAAAGAALSVASSLFSLHDKTLQKEIEASEARQKEMENLTKNVKSVIESTLGGVYSFKATESMKSTIKDQIGNLIAKEAMGKGFEAISGSKSRKGSYLSKQEQEALSSMRDSLKNPDNAYLMQKASLNAQLTELKEQKSLEESKKKSDSTKIADYKQQIIEMEQQINTFKEDFLKDVYSIDMKSWASELTDAVVGAWEKGEDAVDAYKDKVKDLVKDLTKNILTQKIVEQALQGPLDTLTDYLDKHDGKLDEGVIKQFAKEMNDVNEKIVPEITSILDALKNEGLDLRENGSSSTSNSVQGITEDTADLLSSYVNSMRADLSMVLETQGKYLPEMSEIAKSQLTQLNLIAQNTLRNADAAERIETIFIEYNNNFNRVLNGTKSLKMK